MAEESPEKPPKKRRGQRGIGKRTIAQMAHAARLDAEGGPLSVATLSELDVLRYKMRWHMNRFAALQQQNPPPYEKMEKHLNLAADAAKEGAPYHFSRISGVLVGAMNLQAIEVSGGLPDEQDGSWVDTRRPALEPKEPEVIDVPPEEPKAATG
jgi:hypothetical protein